MPTVPHILSAFTQPWVAWLMLLVLVALGAAEAFLPGYYARAVASLFTSKERDSIFAGSGNDRRSHVLLTAASLLMGALALQWYIAPEGSFLPSTYGLYLGCTCAYALIRFAMQRLVGYTFFPRSATGPYVRHYQCLNACLAALAYPILLTALFWPGAPVSALCIAFLILLMAYAMLVIYKLMACFHLTFAAIFYLPLYFITTELVPFAALLYAARLMPNSFVIS